ncbi:hypothetical protein CMT52_01810 [Elizabethkingia anophelis]|nr:hypothetical protein [Elizabethkingia anophelis]MDV4023067.1 hypothetical protein [Elizabethkingia anophelis]
MKKYISILSLTSVLFMFSCERDISDLNNPHQKEQSTKLQSKKISTQNKNSASGEIDQDQAAKDDEEPKRDKQHWRIKKDTVMSDNTL